MGFSSALQGRAAHDALLLRQEAELRLLDSMKRCLCQKAKCDKDYAIALAAVAQQGLKMDRADDLQGSLITKAWRALMEELEQTAKQLKTNAELLDSLCQDKLSQLYQDKRKARKAYQEEHSRIAAQFNHLTEEVARKKTEYQKHLEYYKLLRSRFEEHYIKSGRVGRKLDDVRDKYQKACRKLHLAHNEYVLLISEAVEVEKDFRTVLLPGLLEHQQSLQEGFIQTWRNILQEASQYGDFTSEKFKDIQKRVELHIINVNPAEEYREFTERHKTSPAVPIVFQFDETLIEDTLGKLQPNTLTVDNLTVDWLRSRLTDLENSVKDLQEKQNKLTTESGTTTPSTPTTNGVNGIGKDINKYSKDLNALRCQEKQMTKLADMIKNALNDLGCEELPSGCDDLSVDHSFENNVTTDQPDTANTSSYILQKGAEVINLMKAPFKRKSTVTPPTPERTPRLKRGSASSAARSDSLGSSVNSLSLKTAAVDNIYVDIDTNSLTKNISNIDNNKIDQDKGNIKEEGDDINGEETACGGDKEENRKIEIDDQDAFPDEINDSKNNLLTISSIGDYIKSSIDVHLDNIDKINKSLDDKLTRNKIKNLNLTENFEKLTKSTTNNETITSDTTKRSFRSKIKDKVMIGKMTSNTKVHSQSSQAMMVAETTVQNDDNMKLIEETKVMDEKVYKKKKKSKFIKNVVDNLESDKLLLSSENDDQLSSKLNSPIHEENLLNELKDGTECGLIRRSIPESDDDDDDRQQPDNDSDKRMMKIDKKQRKKHKKKLKKEKRAKLIEDKNEHQKKSPKDDINSSEDNLIDEEQISKLIDNKTTENKLRSFTTKSMNSILSSFRNYTKQNSNYISADELKDMAAVGQPSTSKECPDSSLIVARLESPEMKLSFDESENLISKTNEDSIVTDNDLIILQQDQEQFETIEQLTISAIATATATEDYLQPIENIENLQEKNVKDKKTRASRFHKNIKAKLKFNLKITKRKTASSSSTSSSTTAATIKTGNIICQQCFKLCRNKKIHPSKTVFDFRKEYNTDSLFDSEFCVCDSSDDALNIKNHIYTELDGMTLATNRPLYEEEWFHGVLPREEVVRLLKNEGDFLVRETIRNEESQIVLSVCWNGHKHFIVQTTAEGHFRFEGPAFPSIQELIMHQYQSELPVTGRSGAVLRKPALRERWELSNDDVILIDKIGRGNFGDVYKAKLKPSKKDVAVKTCRMTLPDEQKRKFLQEGRILKQYDHPNIVKLIGICVQKQPIMIVMELVPGGSLLNFLRKQKLSLTTKQLMSMCRDAAAGMRYLESKNCIHRDLAARNCLIGFENIVKISDFGMSREEEEYIVSDGMKQIPIKWTAPEALNFGKYTSLCDVWSYGILMWEIFSKGDTPYAGMSNARARERIDTGYRMPAPESTPQEMYRLMLKCWSYEPETRPHFDEIYTVVDALMIRDQ